MVLQIGRQYVATAPVISNGMIVLSAYQLLGKEAGWSWEEVQAIETMYEGYPGHSDLEQRAYAWFLRQGPSARKRLLNLLQVLEDIDDGPLTLPEI